MRILNLLRRLFTRQEARPAPQAVDSTVKEIQRKLMDAARENGRPRIGA